MVVNVPNDLTSLFPGVTLTLMTILLAHSFPPLAVISNDYCNSNIECGFESNSVCYNGTCICKLGYHWTPQ